MTLADTWVQLGRRLAVLAGASTALVCLLTHNTLLTASIRGGLALVGTLFCVRLGHVVFVAFQAGPKPAKQEASRPRRVST